ncbi:MAG: nucleotidyltransferase family protein [Candidatus Omnitrophota bacterium]
MKVIVLAAGYATRLYPLTEGRPKALLPVGGRPILEHLLDRLTLLPVITGVIIVTNHRFAGPFGSWAKMIRKYPWRIEVVDDHTSSNENRLGAMGDLAFTIRQKKIVHEDLLVLAGDNLFDFDLLPFHAFGIRNRPHACVAVFDVRDKLLARRYGLVRLAGDGKVLEFMEKPEQPATTLASCGIYWFPDEVCVLLDRYLAGGHNADQPGHFMRWLAENDAVYALALNGMWYDIGDFESYRNADIAYRAF